FLRGLPIGAAVLAGPSTSRAQDAATGSLERFEPSVSGDAMFGVPSPAVGGHLVPRGTVTASYAHRPLSIESDAGRFAIVSDQLFLHAGFSFALYDRLLLSVNMPFALYQDGDSP